jgi:hypothetical protein
MGGGTEATVRPVRGIGRGMVFRTGVVITGGGGGGRGGGGSVLRTGCADDAGTGKGVPRGGVVTRGRLMVPRPSGVMRGAAASVSSTRGGGALSTSAA